MIPAKAENVGIVKNTNSHRRPSKTESKAAFPVATEPTVSFHAGNFEDILYAIKPHSVWQYCVLASCLISLVLLNGLGFGQPVFVIGQMDYECVAYDDGTTPSNFSSFHLSASNGSSPPLTSGGGGGEIYEQQTKSLSCTSPRGSSCKSWHYSSPYYVSTMVSEWNLVCSRSYLRSVYQLCFLGGYLIGMIVLGTISDAFGRAFVVRICWPLILLTYVGTTWAPEFWLAACMRTAYGALMGGEWVAKFVLIMELFVPERRNYTSTLMGLNFTASGLLISVLGFFIRDWRRLQLVGTCVAVASLPFMLFLPESPRWLVTQQKYDRALAVLKRAAKWNRTTLPVSTADLKFLHDEHAAENQDGKKFAAWQRITVIFAERPLLLKTLIFFVVWFFVSNVYYGITFYGTGVIPGNPYFTFGLMNVLQVPFLPLQLFAIRRLGPRMIVILWLGVTGALFAALGGFSAGQQQSTAQHAICIGLVVAINIFIDNCFTAVYILTGEIYPTVNRQTGMSLCSMVGRVGGAVSPFIANSLGEVWRPLPAIIFSAMCVVALFFVCLLPNLKNGILPDSVRDTAMVTADVLGGEEATGIKYCGGVDNPALQTEVENVSLSRESGAP